jgi:hypothetical protein
MNRFAEENIFGKGIKLKSYTNRPVEEKLLDKGINFNLIRINLLRRRLLDSKWIRRICA